MYLKKLYWLLCILSILHIIVVAHSSFADSYLGDVSHDCRIDLEDTVLALQIVSGQSTEQMVYTDADLDGDFKIGLAEAIHSLRVIAFDLPQGLDCFAWNETAVRKVLQTFAYGGHPSDEQILLWANMEPREAIDEILSFEPFNVKLSPVDFDNISTNTDGTLEGLADFYSSDNPDNYTESSRKEYFDKRSWGGPRYNWLRAIQARGLNTFSHRIGFFETNYHMSVNRDVGVYPFPVIRHYDNIIHALSESRPYSQVLAQGALNAAVAYQYGHNHNVYFDGMFSGNDDFAREYHQLFFGILGDYDHDYHESVSIENTARALTGIRANYYPSEEGGPDVEVYFSADVHHTAPLEILNTSIEGPTAKEKIENLAEVAISHQESLDNLPVIIVRTLADDNLTTEKISAIREMWSSLPEINLLEFLKLYAISEVFHSPDRIKYHSSFDKHLFTHNQMRLSNWELYEDFQSVREMLLEDDVEPFHPVHNVFGHQKGVEAFTTPTIFKNNYNTSTYSYWYYEKVDDSTSTYKKEWYNIIPKSEDGSYITEDVARWLWQRFVADGWKNYGILEKAHLYTLLATGKDLGYILHDEIVGNPHPGTVYYASDLENGTSEIGSIVARHGAMTLELESDDEDTRKLANIFVQRAISFISATPYTFLQEGR